MRYFVYHKVNPVRTEVKEFESREALLNNLYRKYAPRRYHYMEETDDPTWFVKQNVGISWNNESIDNKAYIVIDSIGRIIAPDILSKWLEDHEPTSISRIKNKFHWRYRRGKSLFQHPNWLGFRQGPVPYIRNYHGGRGSGPQVGSERRAAQDISYVRRKRSFDRLEVWKRRGRRGRSWKNQRIRKQWLRT